MISEGSSRDPTDVAQVEQGRAKLFQRKVDSGFKELFEGAAAHYQKRLDFYTKHKPADGPAPEPPLPPFGAICDPNGNILEDDSKIVPYDASIFGLEKARRDCRFEMIKIVREVSSFNYDISW